MIPGKAVIPAALILAATVSTAGAAERTFRHYQFKTTATRVNADLQLSEFQFKRAGAVVPTTGVTVSNPGGSNGVAAGEGASKLIDGSVDTKWYDGNAKAVEFDFGVATTIDGYNLATGNDAEQRDPVSWIISGSDDGTNWTPIDRREFYPVPGARKTFDVGFTLPATPVIADFSSSHTSVLNGKSDVSLSWLVGMADTVSISPLGTVAASGSQTLTLANNTDNTYVITATNSAGTSTSTVVVRTVIGGSASYRYVRFRPLKLRGDAVANSIQFSEFEFYNNLNPVIPVSVELVPGAVASPAAEGPEKLIDVNPDTKYLNAGKTGVIFDMGTSLPTFNTYCIGTANDATPRDPVRWLIEGSADKTTWTLIDNMGSFDFNTPKLRKYYSDFIPLPGASLVPYVTLVGDTIAASGGGYALSWDVAGAQNLNLSSTGAITAAPGSMVLTPTADTTYTITATTAAGKTATAQASVQIVTPPVTTINYANFDASGSDLRFHDFANVLNDFANTPAPADAKRLRITSAENSKVGTAWFRNRVSVGSGFDTTFAAHIIAGTVGADGMAFIIQNHPLGTLAKPANTQENGLAQNALNISLDGYQNAGEPSQAMIKVFTGSTLVHTANLVGVPGLVLGGTSATDIRLAKTSKSAAPYQVRVVYVPGDLDVYMDGIQVISNLNINLGTIGAMSGDGLAWAGFSARTGGLAETHDVTSWTLGPVVAPGTALTLVSHSINVPAGTVALTWTSDTATSYRVTASDNLTTWTTVLEDNIAGAAGQTSRTVNFTAGARLFFRVEKK